MLFQITYVLYTLHYSQTEVLPSPFKLFIAIASPLILTISDNIHLQFLWLIVEYTYVVSNILLKYYQPPSKQ